ncbi:MAG: hypothetical protein IPG04_40055 [Polyangiaceae bacterium]|nr:hypothetical protein [Polyangiaceae bacterium]
MERHGEDVFFSFGGRKWRARSAGKPSATELKLNLVVADEREGGPFFVDSLDLYSARHRGNYLKAAAAELGADEAELRRELAEILQQLERERPTRSAEATTAQGATMSEADRAEALELLCDPQAVRAHRGRSRPRRHRGRGDQQADLVHRGDEPQARGSPWRW